MKCPHCGIENSLVWDENRGTVVCSECGMVVDLIYVNSRRTSEFAVEPPGRKVSTSTESFGKLDVVSQKYLTILGEVKNNSSFYIDSDSFNKYLTLGKRVKVIRKRVRVPEDEYLKRIVSIMIKYPKLCSRTDRAKYAIAAIAYTLTTNGSISVSKLSKELGLSKTHIARLLRVVLESQSFLSEVRSVSQATLAVSSQ
ncbi:MAG: TFIIB-type zinc ribbon-containing protein [Sulfolobales archaeon]|nr:TFIIB-type zinc ribbon-containing protein [Sulfolobales archaeon]MCX8208213.1 TFIIB-type zinc ribbon-containing protein [Sulfolobales archaeon]MDW8010973.1 TFIIB-type zinc ribbon-containing protein [Sulfolobales archaeon]